MFNWQHLVVACLVEMTGEKKVEVISTEEVLPPPLMNALVVAYDRKCLN